MTGCRPDRLQLAWWLAYIVGLSALLLGVWLDAADPLLPPWVALAGLGVLAAVAMTLPLAVRHDSTALLVVAVLLHAAMVCLPPLLSDDLYRYVVDGSMSRAGLSPYGWSPDHPAVADVAFEVRPLVNHAHLVTIYPPVAQALFALFAWSPIVWKSATAAAWVLGCAWIVFRARGGPGGTEGGVDSAAGLGCRLALHPLAVLSCSLDGHVDAWGAVLMAGVFATVGTSGRRSDDGGSGDGVRGDTDRPASPTDRWPLAALAVTVGTGIKWFPVAVLAVLPGHRWWRVASVSALLLAVIASPLLWETGAKVLGSLGVYEQTWGYNGGTFAAVVGVTDAMLGMAAWPADAPGSRVLVRGIQGSILLGGLVWLWWRRNQRTHASASGMALWLVLLMWLGPTHHPWYSLWVLGPGLAAGHPVFVWLCGAAVLGFWGAVCARVGLGWQDPFWLSPLALVVATGLWAMHAGVNRQSQRLRHPRTDECRISLF